jgi:DNA-binding CsgD family transcriptional regulator
MLKASSKVGTIKRLYAAGKTQREIAKIAGTSQSRVSQLLRAAGVKPISKWQRVGATISVHEAMDLYRSGMNIGQVAKLAGVTPAAIKGHLRKHDIPIRSDAKAPGRPGASNPAWNGGRTVGEDGYVWVCVIGEKRRVPEHRVIMENIIGRPLTKLEIVHHMNGVRDDNRPENLVITTRKDHEHYTYVKALQARIRQLEEALHSDTCLGFGSGTVPIAYVNTAKDSCPV